MPVRDFTPAEGEAGLTAGEGVDKGAAYVIVFGLTDQPADLLRGGEAVSALLLLATAEGLATAPLSEAVEVAWPRHLCVGEPYLAVRLRYPVTEPPSPRRPTTEAIKIEG